MEVLSVSVDSGPVLKYSTLSTVLRLGYSYGGLTSSIRKPAAGFIRMYYTALRGLKMGRTHCTFTLFTTDTQAYKDIHA